MFLCSFSLFCPLSKSPCHLSSLDSSIYICLFLPRPSLTSHCLSLLRSLSLCFSPCAFLLSLSLSLSLALSLAAPILFVFLFLANHYSFSFVSTDAAALFCKPSPASLNPRSLFSLIALFQWQGGAAGLAPQCCCRHTAGLWWEWCVRGVGWVGGCIAGGGWGPRSGGGNRLSSELTTFDRQQRKGGEHGYWRWLEGRHLTGWGLFWSHRIPREPSAQKKKEEKKRRAWGQTKD